MYTLSITRALLVALAAGAVFGCARVAITEPPNGTFINDTVTTVSGHVYNTGGAGAEVPELIDLSVEVNGSQVALESPNGNYSTSIVLSPDAIFNPVEADMLQGSTGYEDSDRVVLIVGDSIADGEFSPQSIALQINESGLDVLAPVVSNLVDIDPAELLPVDTVLVDSLCLISNIFGCLGRVTASIDDPPSSISSFDIAFEPEPDQVRADINLNDFELNVFLDGTGLVPNCDVTISANTISLAGDYTLEPGAPNANEVDVQQAGDVSSALTGFNVTFTSGLCDFFIGDAIESIISGFIGPVVSNRIRNFLDQEDLDGNTPIAASIESAIAGVNISGPAGQALNTTIDAPFFKITESHTGITLGSDSRFTTNFGTGVGSCNPPEGAPDLTASYHVAQSFPDFLPFTPSAEPYDIGLGISSSGFNQLLRAMIECGLLISTVTEIDLLGTGEQQPLTTGVLSLFIPELAALDPATAARIEIAPTIAPLITGAPGPASELALLKIAQLNLKIITTVVTSSVDKQGNWTSTATDYEIADIMLDADIGINLEFNLNTGSLVFELAEPEPSQITVKVIENPLHADLSTLELLLPQVVASFLPSLAGGLGGFPLPSFLGLSLDVVEVARFGEMLVIYADLN